MSKELLEMIEDQAAFSHVYDSREVVISLAELRDILSRPSQAVVMPEEIPSEILEKLSRTYSQIALTPRGIRMFYRAIRTAIEEGEG